MHGYANRDDSEPVDCDDIWVGDPLECIKAGDTGVAFQVIVEDSELDRRLQLQVDRDHGINKELMDLVPDEEPASDSESFDRGPNHQYLYPALPNAQ